MFNLDKPSIDAAAALNFSDIGLTEHTVPLVRGCNYIILIVGILGNGLVLSGLANYDVIKVDTASRSYLQNLASVEICYAVVHFLPALVVLTMYRWPFGYVFCEVQQILSSIFATNEIHVVMIMSCDRLLLLHQPLSHRPHRHRLCKFLVAGFLLHDVTVNISYHLLPGVETGYCTDLLSCCITQKGNSFWVPLLFSVYSIILPITVTVLANGMLAFTILRITKQRRSSLKGEESLPALHNGSPPRKTKNGKPKTRIYTKASFIILAISITFVVSYLPYVIQMTLFRDGRPPPSFSLTSLYLASLNMVLNPLIFAVFDREFVEYLKGLVVLALIKCCVALESVYAKFHGGFVEESSGFDFELMNFRR